MSVLQKCLEDSFLLELAKGPWTALQHLSLRNICLGVSAAQYLQLATLDRVGSVAQPCPALVCVPSTCHRA